MLLNINVVPYRVTLQDVAKHIDKQVEVSMKTLSLDMNVTINDHFLSRFFLLKLILTPSCTTAE